MSDKVDKIRLKSEGDWVCEDEACANVNFARRTSCNRCGKEKAESSASKKQIGIEIGKAAAEKSRGLFSADDWQCTKCGNVNWSRRHQCNVCNAPKFGDVEERTGYGGGFNDRGVVEYVSREESDDEFDEFGRKRKKFKKSTDEDKDEDRKQPDPVPKPQRSPVANNSKAVSDDEVEKEEEDEEDEEEDEDDDDGDLSKYDLSGWGDDEDDEDSTKAKASKDSA